MADFVTEVEFGREMTARLYAPKTNSQQLLNTKHNKLTSWDNGNNYIQLIRVLLLLFLLVGKSYSFFRMSKIECLSVDKNLSEFEYCRLKPINRNVSEFSFKLKLHDTINDLTANYELLQKFNRYSPIGINYTLNICKYFTNRKNEKFVTIFFDLMNNYINLNHSCPFKDYIQLEKFYARHDRLPLPILSGEYLFKTSWFVKQKLR
ncbi:uncharacterized protein LOC119665004, partial [Teleopsis dalmanni]|uniref:uncharacterized protein LOC119665004 n=1 Tax=Teleopsis dalmanni TaxID=139649 RepID=UPI0018CE12D4